jgi:NADH-quinone oxidoreductase subunit N|tara:strand:+ start:757 stop:903 length:147 start_codon:yes stop_codon:yes gene_type:complete
MYFDSVTEEHEVDAPADMQLMISTNAIAILALGIFPGSLMALCVSVFL